MPKLTRGILCAIEGIDGSGKTLLASNLYKALISKKFPALLTKEPGDSQLGTKLRTILQEQPIPICSKTEYLLYAADRAQHFDEVIIPALDENKLVISDRLGDSSLVYQGYGRGLDRDMIKMINHWAMNDIEPDLIVYVKIDTKTAQKRLIKRGKVSVFDEQSMDFFDTLIRGFDKLYKNRKNVLHLDGMATPEKILQQAIKSIISWINKQNTIT